MPEIKTTTTDELPEPEAGKVYKIGEVEEFTSAVRGFKGLRVDMKDSKGNTVVASLWLREVVGLKSKLGSFIKALGKNTDNWKGKKVRVVKWGVGNREVELVS